MCLDCPVVSGFIAVTCGLSRRNGDALSPNPASAHHDIGDLLATDPSRVPLIVMGMPRQKSVCKNAGIATYRVDTLTHLGAPIVSAGAERRVMRRDDQGFAGLATGNSLESLFQPIKLRGVAATVSFKKTRVFK